MISFRNVRKSFGPKDVLRGVSFDVEDGEVFFIIGASGVGKSVLIKHLIGCSTRTAARSGSTARRSAASTSRRCTAYG